MRRSAVGKRVFLGVLLVLGLSVALAVVSFLPVADAGTQTSAIIDSSFALTPREAYRQGLGAFHGNENITLIVSKTAESPVNFTLLTYGGPRYSNLSASNFTYCYSAGADYYEAVFLADAPTSTSVHFQVLVQKPAVAFPFAYLGDAAKAMFVASWAAILLLIVKPFVKVPAFSPPPENGPSQPILHRKNLRRLKIAIIVSLLFWLMLLAVNSYPLATFENWYTDAARHPYTSTLFTKVGFSVFDTSLGKLSSVDTSFFKFVTWAEMPHLYPLGSVFLFLPFGALLEGGVAQAAVFKMEIALLLVASHVCLYFFLKRFWSSELDLSPREFFLTSFWKKHVSFALKAVATYILYIILVVYAANGQFDSLAFLFTLPALAMFLQRRDDLFLLLVAVASTFKYQAGIFLLPLIILALIRLAQQPKPLGILRNKLVLAAVGLAAVDLFTAYLSAPFLMDTRPELIMSGVNAFVAHAQISWVMQVFAVTLTLGVTLACAFYMLSRSRVVSFFMVFSLLPIFTMPYFQPWYLPFFFIYPLIPQPKNALAVTLGWLVFIVLMLSFGGLSYNPLAILDNIRRILGL